MDNSTNYPTTIEWQLPDSISDELLMPSRIAYENFGGKELRQGRYPGICETSTLPNGCYNSDKSKGSVPLTVKYDKNASLPMTKIREEIELLLQQSDISQDTQFQIKEGVDWNRMQKLRETATFTVMSTRHLGDQERISLAQELMSFKIKYFFLSKAQIILKLDGADIEVLRNLLHCSTTYLPFGQRQQSAQISLSQITALGGKWHRIAVKYSPVGSMPSIPLQIAKSSILTLVENEVDIINTDLGYALINTFAATKFEFHVIVSEDNVNTPMLTFWIPNDVKRNFPSSFSVKDKKGTTVDFTIEHCGNILPQSGAPGEPPRHETKGEHWRRIGEKSNPSFKNRLTVIAPVSTQSASQKRRFGLLKDSAVSVQNQQISYTYAEEAFPWILFLERPPESDIMNIFLTHFSHLESVNGDQGDYCKQSFLKSENISKFTRIMMFELPSGKQCQVNRIDGLEGSLYLTKVDALQVYSFKASYLVLLVPPFFDFRALLGMDTKVEALVAWKFQKFCDNNAVGSNLAISQGAFGTSQHCDKHLKSDLKSKPNDNSDNMTGNNSPSKEHTAHPVAGSESATTPPSQYVNPCQNTLIPPDTIADANTHEFDQVNLDVASNGNKSKADEQSCLTANGKPLQDNLRPGTPTVSPTAPWTQLPTSQPLQSKEKTPFHPVSNQTRPSACAPVGGDADQAMLPPQPPHMSTPLKKTPNLHDDALSSQKTGLKELKTACIDSNKGYKEAANSARKSSDPILTPSSPLQAHETWQGSQDQQIENDPIEHTPLNQPKVLDMEPDGPTKENPPVDTPPSVPDDITVVEVTKDPHNKFPSQHQVPVCSTPVGKELRGSSIQDAFKRTAALSANDGTQICIDITGDDNGSTQGETAKSYLERERQAQPSQVQFASLAPFTEVSHKWFHALDAAIVDALAVKAQDVAINCCHISSMNNALYLLSQGPWVPTHVIVHVRQAALAAVGIGWSWVNQVPTAFPFTCYEACLSLATLNVIPSNCVTPNDAIYEIYSTICANLCQPTRNFLFSRCDLQCQACTKASTVQIDTFVATLKKDTQIDALGELLIPLWNKDEIKENKMCPCLDASKAQWKCSKFGPLVVVRVLTPKGVSLPKIEEERLPLGHTFMFHNREYVIRCLITTTRVDTPSQMIIVHPNQPGLMSLYDRNNGIRIVDKKHVSGKLLVSGLVILPVNSPKAILMTKQLAEATGEAKTAQYKRKQIRVVKDVLKLPRKPKRAQPAMMLPSTNRNNAKTKSRKKRKKKDKRGPSKSEKIESTFRDIDSEGLPRVVEREALAKIGVISMFDGVSSVYHIIKKKLGRPPTVFIAAEIDPVLRRLVAAEIGLREDQQWGYTLEGVTTIYVKDVWTLVANDSLILRQAKAMHPTLKWVVIAGSPCQDLTYAGFLNGLLGLTGQRSMLFFVVYIVILHLQKLFGIESVRYLTENAGSMQPVQPDKKQKNVHRLEQSEHFQLFLYCLGLPSNQPVKQWIWDTSSYYGIQRKRVFLRSHLDTDVPPTTTLVPEEEWGPLTTLKGEEIPLAPLLRTRGTTSNGILKLSWTGYQPCALLWDYSFFGGKKSFMLLCQMTEGMRVPRLPWASFIPAHFLALWKSFLLTLQSDKAVTSKKDQLLEQLAPIFHNPNIKLPMRILTVQEVRKLAGLENILTTERHGSSLLTEQVIRDFCGNSFHPPLISAALGTDDQLQQWTEGTNDAQPCAKELPSVEDVYVRYRNLLKLVIEQAAGKGIQLKSDRVDFEAKWRHLAPRSTPAPTQPPAIHQPTVFAFLQGPKPLNEQHTHSTESLNFGDETFSSCLTQHGIEWLRASSKTYENVTLSAYMVKLAVQNGIGIHADTQEIKTKHIQLLQEYTGCEQLSAIKQLFVVFQIATLSVLHQFPFGFIIWAPKVMQPPLVYVGAQRPCLVFLMLSHEPGQPFKFGTVAFDYRQGQDYFAHAKIPKILADVVQLSYQTLATFPITVRINEGQQYIHLSEFAALQCPFCALCYLHSLGASPCFLHNVTPANAIMHLVGGLDGTGGLSIIGTVATEVEVDIDAARWIVTHVIDNHQVHFVAGLEAFTASKVAIPLVWSPMWYAHTSTLRRMPRQLGTQIMDSHMLDPTGEYLITANTEEWSRLLFAREEVPMES